MFSDHHPIPELRFSIPQAKIRDGLNMLWKAVEESMARKFPDIREEDLPKNIQQESRALYFRMQEIIIDMAQSGSSVPEDGVMVGIRNRTLRLMENIDQWNQQD